MVEKYTVRCSFVNYMELMTWTDLSRDLKETIEREKYTHT